MFEMKLYTIQTDAGCIRKFIKPIKRIDDIYYPENHKLVLISVPLLTWLLFTIFDIEPKIEPCG